MQEVYSNKHVLTDHAKAMVLSVLDNTRRLVSNGTISDLADVGITAGHLRDIVFVATGSDDNRFEYFEYGCMVTRSIKSYAGDYKLAIRSNSLGMKY